VVLRNFRRVTRTIASQTQKWRRCLSSRHSAPSLSHRRVHPGRAASDGSTARARGRLRSDRQATSILSCMTSERSLGSRCRIYERIAARCRRTMQPEPAPPESNRSVAGSHHHPNCSPDSGFSLFPTRRRLPTASYMYESVTERGGITEPPQRVVRKWSPTTADPMCDGRAMPLLELPTDSPQHATNLMWVNWFV
jgi:hypothetical protein